MILSFLFISFRYNIQNHPYEKKNLLVKKTSLILPEEEINNRSQLTSTGSSVIDFRQKKTSFHGSFWVSYFTIVIKLILKNLRYMLAKDRLASNRMNLKGVFTEERQSTQGGAKQDIISNDGEKLSKKRYTHIHSPHEWHHCPHHPEPLFLWL